MRKLIFITTFFFCSSGYALDPSSPGERSPTLIFPETGRNVDINEEARGNALEENREVELQNRRFLEKELEKKRVERMVQDTKLEDKRLQEERLQRIRLDDARNRQRATDKWIEQKRLDDSREQRRLDDKRWRESQRK